MNICSDTKGIAFDKAKLFGLVETDQKWLDGHTT
jgi:hypothetical protein